METEITREGVAEPALSSSRAKARGEVEVATARYLAAGGAVTFVPDTVELQRAHLAFLMRLEGTGEPDEL